MRKTNTTHDDIPKPTDDSRLHLYLAWGCPFCHRVMAALALTGLTKHVTITWMRNIKGPAGWEIAPGDDPLFAETSLKRVYERLEPNSDQRPVCPSSGRPVVKQEALNKLFANNPLFRARDERCPSSRSRPGPCPEQQSE